MTKPKLHPFKLTAALAAKIGSILVHVDEFTSSDAHQFDLATMQALIVQPDVQDWLQQLSAMSLVPKKRK